jgi:hypothetical protein
MEVFLGFLAEDMTHSPQRIKPLDRASMARIASLVKNVDVDPDEDLGDEPLV